MKRFILHYFFPIIHCRINTSYIVKLLTVIIIKFKIIIIEQVFIYETALLARGENNE